MEGFTDVVLDTDGRPIEGASITVTDYPAGTASTLYSDDGITPLGTNVLTTDSLGRYTFFAADGRYTRVITKSGYSTTTLTDLTLLDDPEEGSLTVPGLTDGRLVLAGVGGLLQDSTSATYSSNHFTFHTLTVSTGNLTVSAGQIRWGTTGNQRVLAGEEVTFSGTANRLTVLGYNVSADGASIPDAADTAIMLAFESNFNDGAIRHAEVHFNFAGPGESFIRPFAIDYHLTGASANKINDVAFQSWNTVSITCQTLSLKDRTGVGNTTIVIDTSGNCTIDPGGALTVSGRINANPDIFLNGIVLMSAANVGAGRTVFAGFNNSSDQFFGGAGFQFTDPSSGGSVWAYLSADAAGVLAQRNGTNAQAFRIYNTFTDASNYERGGVRWNSNFLQLFTEAAGSGTIRSIDLTAASGTVRVNGCNFIWATDNSQDIGASGASRPRTGYFGTSVNLGVSANNYMEMGQASTTLPVLGPTTTAVGLIPDGAIPLAITSQVISAIGGTTGYQIGDGSDADRWGAITGSAVGTDSDNTDWTVTTVQAFIAAQNIVLTASSGSFTGGSILVHVGFLRGVAL